MPLPNIKRRCTAVVRNGPNKGNRCSNGAAFGCKTCRYHGARRRSTIRAEKDHPQYKHGRETTQTRVERGKRLAELRELEALAFSSGLMVGRRTPGRRPKG